MKKYLLTAAVMLAGLGIALAEQWETPTGPPQALATADYGGVEVSTSQFSASITTAVSSGYGVFYGCDWSTGPIVGYSNASDFIDVFDSTSPPVNTAQRNSWRLAIIYNTGGGMNFSTAISTVAAGFTGPPQPKRFRRGLYFQPSVDDYNIIGCHYYVKP